MNNFLSLRGLDIFACNLLDSLDDFRCPEVTVTTVPPELGLDPFYEKYVDAEGLPIVVYSQDVFKPAYG